MYLVLCIKFSNTCTGSHTLETKCIKILFLPHPLHIFRLIDSQIHVHLAGGHGNDV